MKFRLALTALLAVCTMASVTAFADDEGDKDGRPRGPRPGGPPKAEDIFKRMDSNGDGKVTLDEFKKAHERLQAMMRHHGPPHFWPGGPRPGAHGYHPPHHPPFRADGGHGHHHPPHHGHHGHYRGHHHDHGHHGRPHGDKKRDDDKKDDKKETSAAVDYRV